MRQFNIRVPESLIERVSRLVDNPPSSVSNRGPVTQAVVAREAMVRGLAELEKEAKREGKS